MSLRQIKGRQAVNGLPSRTNANERAASLRQGMRKIAIRRMICGGGDREGGGVPAVLVGELPGAAMLMVWGGPEAGGGS